MFTIILLGITIFLSARYYVKQEIQKSILYAIFWLGILIEYHINRIIDVITNN